MYLLQIIFFFNVIYFKQIFLKNILHKILSYCLFYSWTMSNVLELLIKISNKLGFILTFLYVFNVF